jgi:opacity protein-like surface antigen
MLSTRERSRIAWLAALLFFAGPGFAAQKPFGEKEEEPAGAGIWRDGIGSGFQADTLGLNFSLGGGFGIRAIGSTQSHDLAIATTSVGWVFTDVMGEDTPFTGNWEVVFELFGGGQISPKRARFLGFSPQIRYDFTTGTPWVPFMNGGVGVVETDIGEPDISTRFEFNVQVGAGVHLFLQENLAFTFEYRWFHISNAQIETPNHGTNTQVFTLGMSYFF